MANPVEYILYTAGVLTAIVGISSASRGVWRWFRSMNQRLDDLVGEPPRPGFKHGRPGVLERLETIDEGLDTIRDKLAGMDQRLTDVEGFTRQLRPNGGAHLADAIARIEEHLGITPPGRDAT